MINEVEFLDSLKGMLSTEDDIEMETDLMDLEGWDSFSMMSFIAMAEEKYGIKLKPFTVAGAVLVEDLYDVVKDAVGRD